MSWGEIYNTSWWGVALDTARTVKARPDFFGSQLNLLTSEQPNLVVNGTFDTDSDWDLGSAWSVNDGKALYDGSSNGSLIKQLGILTSGKKYKASFNVLDNSGRFRISVDGGSSTYQTYTTGNGYYTFEFTSTTSDFRIGGSMSDSADTFSIDNVSVQLVRADLDQIEAKKCLADWIHTTALKDLNN